MSAVVDLLHVANNLDRIRQYHDAMLRGERFPPVSVIRAGKVYLVADGHKRFTAYMQLSIDEITVEIWTIRRWLLDQWQQFTKRSIQPLWLLIRTPVDAEARKTLSALVRSTLAHWRRVAVSLLTLPGKK